MFSFSSAELLLENIMPRSERGRTRERQREKERPELSSGGGRRGIIVIKSWSNCPNFIYGSLVDIK